MVFRKKTEQDLRCFSTPPAIWRAFAAQGAWRNWVIVAQLGLLFVFGLGIIALVKRPPEYVVVDGQTGDSVLVKHSLSHDELLRFIASKTKPPKISVVRFTRDFLHLALAVNSSTIEVNWPAALSMMSPGLRAKLQAEAIAKKLVETYKVAQRKTELKFDSLEMIDRTDSLLAVRAVMTRRVSPLLDSSSPSTITDHIQVDVVEEIVPHTVDNPDGLQVVEWRLAQLEATEPGATLARPVVSGTEGISNAR